MFSGLPKMSSWNAYSESVFVEDISYNFSVIKLFLSLTVEYQHTSYPPPKKNFFF